MLTFDLLTLKAFIDENKNFLTGSRIQKIQQPTRRELLFTLRNNSEIRKFYINIFPQFFHICFLTPVTEHQRLLEIPKKPPMFCMQLRKYLENARIIRINQPENERILEIFVETFNELQEKIELCLAIELMGKHSNVILYNTDTNIIIGCAHNVGSDKSSVREIMGTLPYIYPPQNSNFNINSVTSLIEKLRNENTSATVNEIIDKYYAKEIEQYKLSSLKSELKSITNKKLIKIQKDNELMRIQLEKEKNADKFRLYGDMLMANLYNLKDFVTIAKVQNWENGEICTIPLDETLTIKENANIYYKKYTKSKRKSEKLTEMLENGNIQAQYYSQIIYSIEVTNNYSELLEIKNELIPVFEKPKKSEHTEILEKEIDGYKIYIGRNNKQNDYIVSKLAQDEDYWFHVHNCAGSHVLLKCAKPTDKIIFECAKLAKEYSNAKLSSKIGVIYTQRKNLKKPPAAPLGYVTYKGEVEIIVD